MLAACRRRDERYLSWLAGRGYRILPPEAFGHDGCEHDPPSVNAQPICKVNGPEEQP